MEWVAWIGENWLALEKGSKIEAPWWLVPLAQAGFRRTECASPEGRAAHWTLALDDRSRIHVHEYPDGRRVVHRDKHNPEAGPADMIAHLMFDTPWGIVAVVGGLVWFASSANE